LDPSLSKLRPKDSYFTCECWQAETICNQCDNLENGNLGTKSDFEDFPEKKVPKRRS